MKKSDKAGQAVLWMLIPRFVVISYLALFVFLPGKLLALEENIDRPGSDYKHFPLMTADPKLCQEKCQTDPGIRCKAFTYVKQTKTCWLKEKIPLPKSNSCCVSGVVRKNVCVHGNTGQFQDKGVDGSHYGWGVDYNVSGKGSWIHYSIPTSESDMVIEGVQIKFTISNPKYGWISAIHVFDGNTVLQKFDNQRYGSSLSSEKRRTRDLLLPLSKPVRVSKGVGISILPESKSAAGLSKIVNIEIHSVCVLTSNIP